MSPQVHQGEPADKRNDIYALGIIIYELLTGRTSGMIRSICKLKPDLDSAWQTIFENCTADELDDRYQTVEELEAAVRRIGAVDVEAPVAQSGKTVSVLVFLLFLAVCGVFYSNWYKIEPAMIRMYESIADHSTPVAPLASVELQAEPATASSRITGSVPRVDPAESKAAPASAEIPEDDGPHLDLVETESASAAVLSNLDVRIVADGLPRGTLLEVINAPEGTRTSFDSVADFALPAIENASEDYMVRFSHPDFETAIFTVPSRKGNHAVEFTPVQLRTRKTFSIGSEPQGAAVFVGAEGSSPVGITPLELPLSFVRESGLEPFAPVQLRLAMEGFEAAEQVVYLDSPDELGAIEMVPLNQFRTIKIMLPGEVELNLVYISDGEFVAGSPEGELGRVPAVEKQRTVTIEDPFYIGVTEVTRSQYRALMGKDTNFYRRSLENPAEQIVFPQLTGPDGYLAKLTEHIRSAGYGGWQATLPTNDEWEYAARAGTETTFYSGENISSKSTDAALDDISVYLGTSLSPQPVGSKQKNPWGLYDMLGNVMEWTAEGDLRGGSFMSAASLNRPAFKLTGLSSRQNAGNNFRQYGFRVVLRPPAN